MSLHQRPPAWVACAEPPVLALPTGDEIVLLTNGGWCFRVGSDGRVTSVPQIEGWAGAAAAADGTLVVGQYRGMLASLRGGDWEYRPLDAPALAIAAGSRGIVVGDVAGGVTLFPGVDGRPEVVPFCHPVADLCPTESGVIALGIDGALGWRVWGAVAKGFESIALPASIDRPVGLFAHPDPNRVGVYSADVVGVLDVGTGRLRVGKKTFPEGIRLVVAVGQHPGYYAVLTDSGRLYNLAHPLDDAHPVVCPDEQVAGVCPVGPGGLLAWTSGGGLFAVGRDRTAHELAAGDVVLACPSPSTAGQLLVVRWAADRGVQVQLIQPDPLK